CFFFIADYHSLTTHPDPGSLHGNIRDVLSEYLAAGLDPDVATIYVQSDVPEVAELQLLLSMHAHVPELLRTASFKDKASKLRGRSVEGEDTESGLAGISAGLLCYPVLMAADILQHRADKVPVGKDQEQHLEMTRFYARRFNSFYGVEYFREPAACNFGTELVKVPGLDGSGKMGKSEGNGLYLSDSDADIRRKVMRAVSDGGPTEPDQPMAGPVANLFTLLELVSSPDTVARFRADYSRCEIRYGDLKKQLAEDIVAVVSPIRERIEAIRADDAYLRRVTAEGAERARASSAATLADVRGIMGIKRF
ncbi:MAG: tryptophan--tRNA ligase, partial [Alistipes sp.]|nr:tryptophan--tRNA ligase [Alistipes sp.]